MTGQHYAVTPVLLEHSPNKSHVKGTWYSIANCALVNQTKGWGKKISSIICVADQGHLAQIVAEQSDTYPQQLKLYRQNTPHFLTPNFDND